MNDVVNRLLDELKQSHQSQLALTKDLSQKKQEYKSTETKDLYTALAKAQAEMGMASLNTQNPYFKTRYADLSEIVKVSRPALSKNGLSVTQQIISNDDGGNVLITTLAHNSGQYIESRMRIIPPKSDVQTLGSYITYLRRYSYAALVGIVTGDEDDDGEEVMADQRKAFAKGPAQVNYEPKKQPYETISRDQLVELELELANYPDIAQEVLERLNITSLADMRKAMYSSAIKRVREIIRDRQTIETDKK